jgi:hypothetical protein
VASSVSAELPFLVYSFAMGLFRGSILSLILFVESDRYFVSVFFPCAASARSDGSTVDAWRWTGERQIQGVQHIYYANGTDKSNVISYG